MNFSEFILTDGTTKIDFLAANKRGKGVAIEQYTPGRAQPKEGGVWQDSMLAPGRRLVYQSSGNITDTVVISIAYSSAEQLVAAQEELDLLLNKALSYWTVDWQDEPVYIQAMAHGETARRYAIIYGVSMSEYSDPYDQPYAGGKTSVATDLTLGLERSFWTANPPGEVTAIAISHEKHAADSTIFVGNGSSTGITEIRRYTETPSPAYSSNLLLGSLPYALFDAAGIAAEDTTTAVYFGSPYPFTSIVFDIGTTAANLDIKWESSDGVGGWQAVTDIGGANPLRDETGTTIDYGEFGGIVYVSFTIAGLHIVQWFDNYNIQPQALSTFGTLYWIRARFNGPTDTPFSGPTQQTQHPYTTKVPYIEIAESQIDGNLDALASIQVSTKSRDNDSVTLPQSVLMGLRSIYRSGLYCGDFSAYLNMRTQDNPTGVAIDLTGETSHVTAATLQAAADSPTNYMIYYVGSASDELDEAFRVNFGASVVRQYYGRYRLFAKLYSFDLVGGNVKLRCRVKFEGAYAEFVGPTVALATGITDIGLVWLIDLGYIRIPPTNMVGIHDESSTVSLIIDAVCSAGHNVRFYELVLLPVDEWSAVATGTTLNERGDYILNVDSAGYPKEPGRAILKDPDSEQVIDTFPLISNQNIGLHAQSQQRLWFLQRNTDAHYGMSAAISISVNPRFYNLRRVT